jgi:hypothetical protein
MHLRRPLLKRVAIWTAAAVLLPLSYLVRAPFVIVFLSTKFSSTLPVLVIAYEPAEMYLRSDLPGSALYERYAAWTVEALSEQ